jgi:hypothetical protein
VVPPAVVGVVGGAVGAVVAGTVGAVSHGEDDSQYVLPPAP